MHLPLKPRLSMELSSQIFIRRLHYILYRGSARERLLGLILSTIRIKGESNYNFIANQAGKHSNGQ